MEICVFAETIRVDQSSYEILLERLLSEHFQLSKPTIRRLNNIIFRGKGDLITQLPIVLRSITRKYANLDCIFIFADADGEYPSKTNAEKKRVRDKTEKFQKSYGGEIIVGIPTSNIEAWLLGDIDNINYVTGLSISTEYSFVEDIKEPKEKFKAIYTEYRKANANRSLSYSELIVKLFSSINFQTLRSKSKTFKNMVNDLRSYLKRAKLLE